MRYKIFRFAILIAIYLTACSSNVLSEKDSSFENVAPVSMEAMNRQITLSLPALYEGIYEPKAGETLHLEIQNHTNEIMYFPSDYGVSVYRYYENNWTTIENLLEGHYYPISNRSIFPRGENSLGVAMISVAPALTDLQAPIELRIVVLGSFSHQDVNNSDQIGAYLDILLEP